MENKAVLQKEVNGLIERYEAKTNADYLDFKQYLFRVMSAANMTNIEREFFVTAMTNEWADRHAKAIYKTIGK